MNEQEKITWEELQEQNNLTEKELEEIKKDYMKSFKLFKEETK